MPRSSSLCFEPHRRECASNRHRERLNECEGRRAGGRERQSRRDQASSILIQIGANRCRMDWTANFWNHRRQFLVSSRTSAASQPCVSRTHNANLYVGCVCSRAHVFVGVNAWYGCRHGARNAAGNLTRGSRSSYRPWWRHLFQPSSKRPSRFAF